MKFKIGDRVAVYGSPMNTSGDFYIAEYGVVEEFGLAEGSVGVLLDDTSLINSISPGRGSRHWFHEKQYRRLVKKLKTLQVHKDVWAAWKKTAAETAEKAAENTESKANYICFQEVRGKKAKK